MINSNQVNSVQISPLAPVALTRLWPPTIACSTSIALCLCRKKFAKKWRIISDACMSAKKNLFLFTSFVLTLALFSIRAVHSSKDYIFLFSPTHHHPVLSKRNSSKVFFYLFVGRRLTYRPTTTFLQSYLRPGCMTRLAPILLHM